MAPVGPSGWLNCWWFGSAPSPITGTRCLWFPDGGWSSWEPFSGSLRLDLRPEFKSHHRTHLFSSVLGLRGSTLCFYCSYIVFTLSRWQFIRFYRAALCCSVL